MKITVKGIIQPDQDFDISETPPFDSTNILNEISDLKMRVYKLENPITIPVIPTIFYKSDCIWNKKLTNESIHPNSVGFITELKKNLRAQNAWINSIPYGVPIFFTSDKDKLAPIYKLTEPGSVVTAELLKGVHLPSKLIASAGTDAHACIINLTTGFEHGFWKLKFNTTLSRWECSAAYICPNAMTSDGTTQKLSGWWNSATASHINLGAGCIRKRDLESGVIPHALAFAVSVTTCAKWDKFVYPARSSDGSGTQANSIPMGTRMRLPSNVLIDTNWTPLTKMLVTAVRDYGMILRDTTKGSGVAFYAEDCTQFGITTNNELFEPYLNGKKLWDVVGNTFSDKEFPWSKLVFLQ